MLISMCSSLFLLLWYNMAGLHLKAFIRLPLNTLNAMLFTACCICLKVEKPEDYAKVLMIVNNHPISTIGTFLGVLLVSEVYHRMVLM